MSNELAAFRRKEEEIYVQGGGEYKVKAYDSLRDTHRIISNFFGSPAEHTFVVSNSLRKLGMPLRTSSPHPETSLG